MTSLRNPLPAIERIRAVFDYNPWTGAMTRAGRRAGTRGPRGYLQTWIDGRSYKVHRLAWAHYYGCDPPAEIDHINGDRADNRASNLRLATREGNNHNSCLQHNNKLGIKGVVLRPSGNYEASLQAFGRRRYLGVFDTAEAARAAHLKAAREYHGDFARVA